MGRAIDMEKDIYRLNQEVKELKEILQEILSEVKKDEQKKTNSNGAKKSTGKSDSNAGTDGK